MSRRDAWAALYDRFDPEAPASRSDWRAPREYSPVHRILQGLETPFGDRHVLLTGTVGSGKTTELLRLAEARAEDDLVVYLDLVRHFGEVMGDMRALQKVGAWEVVFLVGIAVVRAAQDIWDHRWERDDLRQLEKAWQDAARAAGHLAEEDDEALRLEVANLMKSMIVLASGIPGAGRAAEVGLKTLSGAISSVRWTIPIGEEQRALPDQRAELQALLAAVNHLLGSLGQAYSRRVLVLVDGLDRIRDLQRATELFVESELLSRLACPLVVTAPFALRHSMATTQVRGFDIHTLVNVPVVDQQDATALGPGAPFFMELYDRRAADLERGQPLITREQLARFAYYSGGRARDFVRLVQLVAERGWHADVDVAEEPMIDEALDDARRLLEYGMHRGLIAVLEAVRDDPDHRLPDDEDVWDLLAYGRLVPYPNGTEWYFPHPLLTLTLLGAPKPAAG